LSSLTESSGLVELDEETTRVEPGQQVGFLPHAVLIS
jgi:molybdopterin molybdotransferase